MNAHLPTGRVPLPFDSATLDLDTAPICVLDAAERITYVNPALASSARDDESTWPWRPGAAFADAVPPALRSPSRALFARARSQRTPADVSWDGPLAGLDHRCRIRAYPCDESTLVVSLSRAHVLPPSPTPAPGEATYRGAYGFIIQCSHCRRTQRLTAEALFWDWVPDYVVRQRSNTSHGVCQMCGDYFYGIEAQSERDAAVRVADGPLEILVLGSDPTGRALLVKILRHAGHRVTETCRGDDALCEAERRPFDIVLLDTSRLRCDRGAVDEVAVRGIRALDPAARVVLVGETSIPSAASSIAAVVSRPFDLESLLAAVSTASRLPR